MNYPMQWLAGTQLSDKTGTATYKVDGQEWSVRLPDFTAACTLGDLLDRAFSQGRAAMAAQMDAAVEGAVLRCLETLETGSALTERSAEPTPAGTERHTRNEPDPESGISPGSSIPVERGMV